MSINEKKKGKNMKFVTGKIKIIITCAAAVVLLVLGVYAGIQIGKNTEDTQPQAVSLSGNRSLEKV